MTKRLRIVIPLIAMLLVFGYLVIRSTLVTNKLKGIVVSKLTERLMETPLLEDVIIGRVAIRAPTTIVLDDLKISDVKGMKAFVAKEVSISYNLWEVIWNRAQAIKSIKHIGIRQGQLSLSLRGLHRRLIFNQIEGNIKVGEDVIMLEDLRGFMGNILLKAEGKVGTGKKPMVELELVSDNLSLEDIVEVVPRFDGARMKGLARLKVAIRGPLDAPEVTGKVSLARGEIAQSWISAFEASFKYSGGLLELTDLRAKLWGGEIQGRGRVKFTVPPVWAGGEQINLDLALDGACLDEALPHSGLSGSFSLMSHIHGSFLQPSIKCQFTVANPKIFGKRLTPISGEAQLRDHRIRLSADAVDGGFHADGSLVIVKDVLWLDEFWMSQEGGGYFTARGKIGLGQEGNMNLFIEGNDLAIQALPLLKENYPYLGGKLNLDLHWKGTRRAPEVSARLIADDLSLAQCGFEGLPRLRGLAMEIKYSDRRLEFLPITLEVGYQLLGHIDFTKNGIISFEELRLQRGEGEVALVRGNINLWARSMDIGIEVESDLAYMGLSPSAVEYASGPLKMVLHLGGPIGSPELKGDITVIDGKVKHPALVQEISGIRMQARVDNNVLIIQGLEANMGGGDLGIRGRVKLDLEAEEALNLKLTGHGVKLHIPDLMRPDDRAELDLTLYIVGPLNSPLVRGNVDLIDTTFTLLFEGKKGSPGFFGQKVAWDLEVNVGRNVGFCWDKIPYMEIKYLEVRGKLRFKGRGKDIDIVGRLDSFRGQVTCLGTDFDVVETILSSPEAERKLTIYSRARTTVNGTTIFLVYRGFAETYPGGTTKGDIQLYSNPIMTREEIMALLIQDSPAIVLTQGFGLTNEKIRNNIRGLLVLDGLLETKGKEVLGLDVLEVRPDIWGQFFINVGEYIDSDRDWYIAYTRRIPLTSQDQLAPEEEWKLEYRIDQDELLKLRKTREEEFIGLEHLIRF